jgi:putative Holliday junction resolvase
VYEDRIVGIDYGRRRVGLSLSDPLRLTAQPLTTLTVTSMADAIAKVCRTLAEYEIALVVIGRPGSLSGGGGQMAEEVEKFAGGLAKRGFAVELVDERLSSREAKRVLRMMGKSEREMRGRTDIVAAQLILQKYLDRRGGWEKQ